MANLSEFTTQDLINQYDELDEALAMELLMDGSGELGGEIYKDYTDAMNAIQEELDRRGPRVFNCSKEDYFDGELPI